MANLWEMLLGAVNAAGAATGADKPKPRQSAPKSTLEKVVSSGAQGSGAKVHDPQSPTQWSFINEAGQRQAAMPPSGYQKVVGDDMRRRRALDLLREGGDASIVSQMGRDIGVRGPADASGSSLGSFSIPDFDVDLTMSKDYGGGWSLPGANISERPDRIVSLPGVSVGQSGAVRQLPFGMSMPDMNLSWYGGSVDSDMPSVDPDNPLLRALLPALAAEPQALSPELMPVNPIANHLMRG